MDRISQLPQPILQHILSFISQNAAVRTCVLSKSWRHIWSTRPNLEFQLSCFNGSKETFLSVLDRCLQRYRDQNLFIQKILLELLGDSTSISFLEKWIPIVIQNMSVKTFHISFSRYYDSGASKFNVVMILFQAKSLHELHLKGCKLNCIENVLCKHLQTLGLHQVYVAEETLDNILLSCPLIEYLVLGSCEGLRKYSVNKAPNLKHLDYCHYYKLANQDHSIETNIPILETIRIVECPNWYYNINNYFPCLRSVYLSYVQLSTKPFENISQNFPHLEKLELDNCYGFTELELSSRSIKHLTINAANSSVKFAIDAVNILFFEFSGEVLPSISFTKTSNKWKSSIRLSCYISTYFELSEMLNGLSQSQISMDIIVCDPGVHYIYSGYCGLAAVEHLSLRMHCYSSLYFADFLKVLFSVCRPRYMYLCLYGDEQSKWLIDDNQLTEFVFKILLNERIMKRSDCLWQRDLEELNLETFNENRQVWCLVQRTNLADCELPNKQKYRFRFKWREYVKLALLS